MVSDRLAAKRMRSVMIDRVRGAPGKDPTSSFRARSAGAEPERKRVAQTVSHSLALGVLRDPRVLSRTSVRPADDHDACVISPRVQVEPVPAE